MNTNNDLTLEDKERKRTGKEIKLNGEIFNNNNLKFKIGAIFNKQSPETIYVECGFWIDIKERQISTEIDKYSFYDYNLDISKKLSFYLRNIYRKDLRELLTNNIMFPKYLENIFVYDYPENINYNKKRSFVSLEISLHTINIDNSINEKYSLSEKKDIRLFNEAKKICQVISNSELLKGKKEFEIYNNKK